MFVLLLLILSVCLGMLLNRVKVLRYMERTSTWTVWLLIFVFGISLGSNETIVKDFGQFGLSALIIAIAGVAGSVLTVWGIGKIFDKNKKR